MVLEVYTFNYLDHTYQIENNTSQLMIALPTAYQFPMEFLRVQSRAVPIVSVSVVSAIFCGIGIGIGIEKKRP